MADTCTEATINMLKQILLLRMKAEENRKEFNKPWSVTWVTNVASAI
jgi:hypothetical protein